MPARKHRRKPGEKRKWWALQDSNLRQSDDESHGHKFNALRGNDLGGGCDSVTPTVTPGIEKGAILAALLGLSKDELLGLLADVLAGRDEGSGGK
ncbi:MAG: hypothetical protein H3C30_19960 [Candidatus Hydrogenedentes bacterium]|nr:hypothetical protein [Candidatus Hydrogenedentota bacterium]